jgi:glycosyltransferase involved in cell wall biosynthesis
MSFNGARTARALKVMAAAHPKQFALLAGGPASGFAVGHLLAQRRERARMRAVTAAAAVDYGRIRPAERPTVSVVIPAVNEAPSIGWVLDNIPWWVDEVVLVDGLSDDLTELVARTRVPNLVVVHQGSKGKGAALRAGFYAASCDIVAMIDADGSTDPRELDRFVTALTNGADFVKGSREMNGGGSVDFTLLRRLGNLAFVRLANMLYGERFTDLLYGYCAFWRRDLDALALTADGFEIETQLVVNAVKAGLKVTEVPSVELERRAGQSNLNAFQDGLRVLRTVIGEHPQLGKPSPFAEYFERVEETRPALDSGEWLPAGLERRSGADRRTKAETEAETESFNGKNRRSSVDRRRRLNKAVKVLVPRRGPDRRRRSREESGYTGAERRSRVDRRVEDLSSEATRLVERLGTASGVAPPPMLLEPSASVVVCAFADERLELTVRCIEAVLDQQPGPLEVIVVVDHNDRLADDLRARLTEDVTIVSNVGEPGLSSARNTAIGLARGDLVVFVDDDAVGRDGWLAALIAPFADPTVEGAGGKALPDWEDRQPAWFPDAFLWVVGCSYEGQPGTGAVRNPLGCNMAFRREVFERAGLFDVKSGRLGSRPLGCEETELCIRASREIPGAQFVLVPGAEIDHWVPQARGEPLYLIRRCFYEGISKALVRTLGDTRSLDTERRYVSRTLPLETARSAITAVIGPGRSDAVGRIAAVIGGVAAAAVGYLYGTVTLRRRPPEHAVPLAPAPPAVLALALAPPAVIQADRSAHGSHTEAGMHRIAV